MCPINRGYTCEWDQYLSLDVVEYYGPSRVEVRLWESRLLGRDVTRAAFSFPLSHGVVAAHEKKGPSSCYDVPPCRCITPHYPATTNKSDPDQVPS